MNITNWTVARRCVPWMPSPPGSARRNRIRALHQLYALCPGLPPAVSQPAPRLPGNGEPNAGQNRFGVLASCHFSVTSEVYAVEKQLYHTPLGDIRYWVSRPSTDNPWLVFLPGLSADHTLFERQLEHFSRRYPCLVWDAPAHGASRPFALRFSLEDLAEYLHAILETHGINAPVLVGQSLGGYIAQAYIDRHPGTARGFVSIDSAPLSRKYYTAWELSLLKRTGGMYRSIPWKLLMEWGITGTSATAYGRSLMRRIWSVYDREEYCALADHGMRILAQAVEAKPSYPLPCPVLLLCGEKDGAGSAKSYNRRWTKQDGHRLVWLKGAGHNANTDAPEQVNCLIESFVEQQCRTT